MAKFQEKIDFLLFDRKFHSWGATLGVSKGAVESIKKGTIPGGEILGTICHVENANLNWLVAGIGLPFNVHTHLTADEFEQSTIQNLMDSDDYHVHIITCVERSEHLLIWQIPGELDYKGKTISFNSTSIEAGPWSPEHAAAIFSAAKEGRLRYTTYHEISNNSKWACVQDVLDGKCGTYRIENWLRELNQVPEAFALFPPRVNRGKIAEGSLDMAVLKQAVEIVHRAESDGLDESQLAAAIASTYKHLVQDGSIRQESIDLAINMLRAERY